VLTLDLPVLLLVLGGIIGARIAPDADAAWPLFIAILGGLAIYVVTAVVCRFRPLAQLVVGGVVVVAAITALAFLLSASHSAYPDKVSVVTRLRLAIGAVAATSGGWSPFPASVATVLEGAVALAVTCAIAAHSRVGRWSWSLAAAFIAFAVLLTESRGAWVAVASALGVLATWRWKPARVLTIVAAVGLALVLAPTARGPVHQWALALAADSPFVGIGLRGFEFSLSRYVLLIQVPFLAYAHSLYLDAWLQLGLPGLVALVWIAATTVASLMSGHGSYRRSVSWWRTGCNLGVLTLLLHGTTDARLFIDPWCGWPLFVLLGASRGLAVIQKASDHSSTDAQHPDTPTVGEVAVRWSGLAAAVIVVVAVSAWTGAPLAAARTGVGAARQAAADYQLRQRQTQSPQEPSAAGRAEFESALKSAPEHASAHYRLGLLLMNQDHFAEARAQLDAAFRVWPDRPGVKKALGLAAVWTGDIVYAADLFSAQPEMVDELNTWGAYRASRGDTTLAVNAYTTSLRMNAEQPPIRLALDALLSNTSVADHRP